MVISGFEWDDDNIFHVEAHEFTPEEVEEVFAGDHKIRRTRQKRYIALGETLDGRLAFVIEERPVYPHSGYTRRVVWLDHKMYEPLQVEFYDRRNSLLKTLTASGYTLHLERYWRPATMLMVNHQTGKRTTLNWLDYRFGNGLTGRDFDQNTLKRSR